MKPRPGFTLLEVMIALAIGSLLLAGLYLAVSIQTQQTYTGRQLAEQNSLLRAVLTRMGNDIASHLSPVDPRVVGSDATLAAALGISGDTGSTENTTGSTDSSSSSGSTPMAGIISTVTFNLGVQGDANRLTLYVSQPARLPTFGSELGPVGSDLRRITYWLAGDAISPQGLARQEIKLATASDALTIGLPSVDDESTRILAPEATRLSFEYFDGQTWQTSWDGTFLKLDGKTPVGPPAAIAITITVALESTRPGSPRRETTARHVVFLPTANGQDQEMPGEILP